MVVFTVKYTKRLIHDMEKRAESQERDETLDLILFEVFTGSMHRMREREIAQKHTHGCVKCLTPLCRCGNSLWGDKEEEQGKRRCIVVVVLWTAIMWPLLKVSGSAVHHKSTHGRKYTLKCHNEGANMPQTDQETAFWRKKWIIGVTLYCAGTQKANQHTHTHTHRTIIQSQGNGAEIIFVFGENPVE